MASTRDTGTIPKQSVDAPSKITLIIHHQFPSIRLMFPVYGVNNAIFYLSPAPIVDVDSTTQAGFNINSIQECSTGVLIYMLKNIDQFNEDKATCVWLAIIWKVHKSEKPYAYSFLMEYDKNFIWNRNRLTKLVKNYKLFDTQHDFITDTWLMRNRTVLMTKVNMSCEEEYYKLEMTISKGSINENTRRLWYIDLYR
jgi:hypothetical protein